MIRLIRYYKGLYKCVKLLGNSPLKTTLVLFYEDTPFCNKWNLAVVPYRLLWRHKK